MRNGGLGLGSLPKYVFATATNFHTRYKKDQAYSHT
jgi:hypothetical protein